jgi:DNA replication protein DnaC
LLDVRAARRPARRVVADVERIQPGVVEPPPRCEHCGRSVEWIMHDLPMGLGQRRLVVECPCADDRREAEQRARHLQEHQVKVRQLLRQSGIGLRHREARFENFKTSAVTREVVDVCRRFVADFPQAGKGLTLAGPPGTGKTHLGVAITRGLIERGIPAVTVNVPQLMLTLRGSFHGPESRRFETLLELLTGCAHLMLDDFGRERLTDWVLETVYLVVNARYEERRATSITTNLALPLLRERLGEPIMDRLAETNAVYWCQWPSWRTKARP